MRWCMLNTASLFGNTTVNTWRTLQVISGKAEETDLPPSGTKVEIKNVIFFQP